MEFDNQGMFPSEHEYFTAITADYYKKPVVEYKPLGGIIVGRRASIVPTNHPASYLNGGLARTSEVVSYDKITGNFETLNTLYVLAKVEK